jgi:hypothetical protein
VVGEEEGGQAAGDMEVAGRGAETEWETDRV